MIINRVIGNISNMDTTDAVLDAVDLEWYEREKKLLKKISEKGIELGIRVEIPLEDGDILCQEENRILYVRMLPAHLIHISVSTMEEMGRLCFELGNRHLSLAIHEKDVQIPYDEPTCSYLKKLGFQVEEKEEKFLNYMVCHAHGHSQDHAHGHSHE